MENDNTVDKTIRVSRPTFYYNHRGAYSNKYGITCRGSALT